MNKLRSLSTKEIKGIGVIETAIYENSELISPCLDKPNRVQETRKLFVKKNYYKTGEYESFTHKKCTCCQKVKRVDEFTKNRTNSRLGWGYRSVCIICNRQNCAQYAIGNRPKRNKRLRDWRKKNPAKAKRNDYRGRYKKLYGLTIEQLNMLKSANNNKCWICNKEKKRLVVDHCHSKNKVRGILCDRCNYLIGLFEQSQKILPLLIQYLNGKNCHADILLKLANK